MRCEAHPAWAKSSTAAERPRRRAQIAPRWEAHGRSARRERAEPGAFTWLACNTVVGARDGLPGRRERVFRRDRFRCVYCAATFPLEDLTLDHVQPLMRGGDDSEGNLVAACRPCNELKGGMAAWSFLARRPDFRSNFLSAAEACDATHARPVWARLLRAVLEAAEKGT
ncbi:MAG: HNH endonuclease [Longimicrobiales bacterium]